MTQPTRNNRTRGRAFTLAELLVVIAAIVVLSLITLVSVQKLAKGTRLASAKNALTASLAEARGRAMRDNRVVLVTFRARWNEEDPRRRQYTEIMLAEWTGESQQPIPGNLNFIVDRFVPINDAATRELPAGIKVAGPWYDIGDDGTWITQTELSNVPAGEVRGRQFGVMYGPDGSVITRNPESDTSDFYVDIDLDGGQDVDEAIGNTPPAGSIFWDHDHPDDENNINAVTFLAVFDDDEARENRSGEWTSAGIYINDLVGFSGYISTKADRIHFNRYTGVIVK